MDYRVAFADQDWAPAFEGTARAKHVSRGGKTFRLLELTPASTHLDWCEAGHAGLVVEGEIEIEFDEAGPVRFAAGDALMIPDGAADRHRPRALSERALLFLIEDEKAN
ncbi:cupin domain-containing protein [Hyphococcus luteus]|uniref:Phosrestin n=1 Tax=Hyphococcus luteus TaxID=2058213 RepID=A0A2S7K6C0_9PROT|nr:cupin domain-containing protein [Marinicaulis flavus]PQA88026.1 phosrestin [Marinicaulis flavus]